MTRGQFLLLGASVLVIVGSILSSSLPGPWWWLCPLALLGAYQGVIVWGVMDLRLGMFAPSICSVESPDKIIALTFDDGPDPVSTPLVLDALQRAGAHATFFVVGEKVERYPEVLRAIAAGGHEIAVHSYNHQLHYSFLSPSFVRDDILRCRRLIESYGVTCSEFFRPPVGQASPRTAAGMKSAAVTCIGWSVRGGDGVRRRTTAECLNRVLGGLSKGAIVLLHDAWQGRFLEQEVSATASPEERLRHSPAGARALSRLLDRFEAEGYTCLTVQALLSRTKEGKTPAEAIPIAS